MDHEISARQKGTTISWSKSCPESSDLGPTPRGVKPSLSDDTLTLELDQLPRAHIDPAYHDCLLTDRNLKSSRHTSMPRYWLGDQQIISTYSLIHNVGTTVTQASYLELVNTLTLMVPLLPRKAPCQNLRLHLQVEREWVP